jgi:tungstate transport system ATP-binding protein
MSAVVVEGRDLVVVLGGQKVLDIPSFIVHEGEVMMIIGPNGSGKTTLLLTLALLLKPAAGTVLYHGQAVAGNKLVLQQRRRLAVVFQEPLLLNSSVMDNVILGLKLRGVPRGEIGPRAEKWLERFGILPLAKRQARLLSGGEAKRTSLARAFALEPEVLFLDEPFMALDSPTRQGLFGDFERVLRETKTTVLMVTHDRDEATILGDRVAVIMGGTVRQTGAPDEVFKAPVDEEVAAFVKIRNVLRT